MKKGNAARIMMAVSMLIFGTLAPLVRRIGVSSGELALYRAVMAAVTVGGFLLLTGRKLCLGKIKKELLLLTVSGAAMGVNWILLFEAYKYTTVSVATLSYYFAPIIVTALSPLLFKEKPTAKQVLCFAMATLGLCLITGAAGGGREDGTGIAFALGAAVLYAAVMLINKFIKSVEGIERTFIQFLSAIFVLAPHVMLTSSFTLTSLNAEALGALLTVGILHTGIAYCIYFSAIKSIPAHAVALLSYVDPLVAVLVSVIWLNEKITPSEIIGGILILTFTLISEINIKIRRKN
jgi:RarD protein